MWSFGIFSALAVFVSKLLPPKKTERIFSFFFFGIFTALFLFKIFVPLFLLFFYNLEFLQGIPDAFEGRFPVNGGPATNVSKFVVGDAGEILSLVLYNLYTNFLIFVHFMQIWRTFSHRTVPQS